MNLMFSCKEVSMLVSAALDRKLTRAERFKVRVHLLFCRACGNFSEQMEILRAATQRLSSHKATHRDAPVMPEAARKRIQQTLYTSSHHDDDPAP